MLNIGTALFLSLPILLSNSAAALENPCFQVKQDSRNICDLWLKEATPLPAQMDAVLMLEQELIDRGARSYLVNKGHDPEIISRHFLRISDIRKNTTMIEMKLRTLGDGNFIPGEKDIAFLNQLKIELQNLKLDLDDWLKPKT